MCNIFLQKNAFLDKKRCRSGRNCTRSIVVTLKLTFWKVTAFSVKTKRCKDNNYLIRTPRLSAKYGFVFPSAISFS